MTTPARPSTEIEYTAWARDTLKSDFDSADAKSLYALNLAAAVNTVQEHTFWRGLETRLESCVAKYREIHAAELFFGRPDLKLHKKPYASVVNKTWRQNVLWNKGWPKPPGGSWVTLESLYSAIDDLLRTTVVCTFLDGPEHLAADLAQYSKECGLTAQIRRLHRREGYYAHHVYVTFAMDLAVSSGTKQRALQVEFQITTQPQQLLRQLTHPFYEQDRSGSAPPSDEWQWDYASSKFKARYLSHALHLLEAMILDVRDHTDTQ